MSSSSVQPVLALLGHPVAGNPTQYMIEKAFAHHQLDWRYLSLEVAPEDLGDAVRGMRAMGLLGGNCIDPHQQTVLQHLDGANRTAELTGVVNCILRQDGRLIGDNTVGRGMLQSLGRRVDPAGKRIVLLGAGRAARAIGAELALAEAAEITVVNRTEPPGRALVKLLVDELESAASSVVWEDDYQVPAETDVLINATSIGFGDAEARVPLDLRNVTPEVIVADVTANPPRTRLLHEAHSRGCRTLDGLEMFIDQAAISFKLWTGVDPDLVVMREAVEEFLEL